MSVSTILSSPTFSSVSSFDMLSSRSRSSTFSSEEEIVWPLSASDSLSSDVSTSDVSTSDISTDDDDDYVLLSRADRSLTPERSITPLTSDIISNLSRLSVNNASKPRKRPVNCASPAPFPLPERPDSAATLVRGNRTGRGGRRARNRNKKASPTGLGERPIVDDISEGASVIDDLAPSLYEDAVSFITTFLTNPTARDSASHLTFLQSLIIELGLATSSLPGSLNSAKAVLKSKAFINIREYLDVRSQGLPAIQGIMYPSKSALIKDIKRKKNSASLRWVKQNGLQVLLVPCYR